MRGRLINSLGNRLALDSFSIINSLSSLLIRDSLASRFLGSFGIKDSLSSLLIRDSLANRFLGSFSALGRLSYALTLDSFPAKLDSLINRFDVRFRRLVIRYIFFIKC